MIRCVMFFIQLSLLYASNVVEDIDIDGSYSSSRRLPEASVCPGGTIDGSMGLDFTLDCQQCLPGSYAPEGSLRCYPCVAGTYAGIYIYIFL